MVETATGLVLRTRPLTETSLIVHWLTAGFGRLATVAKGAFRLKSPFRGKLDVFYLADFTFVRSQRSELHALREVNLRQTHNMLRRELACLQQAAYCARLIEQVTETETPLTAIFELMSGVLNELQLRPVQPRTILAFELKLLDELGLQPDFAESRLNPGTRQVARTLTDTDWPTLAQLNLSEKQVLELGQFLHGFLIYHLGRMPKGRERALETANA